MAEGDAASRPTISAGGSEPQTYLDDLEKAKALSLETLELDRLRRERRALKQMKQTIGRERSQSSSICETSSQLIKVARHKTITTSTSIETAIPTKCRPRPGPKATITLDQKLPPPPRRQSSGNVTTTCDVQDLMVFSPAEKEKQNSLQELEASIGVVFDGTGSLFSPSPLTEISSTTAVFPTCTSLPPLTHPAPTFVSSQMTTAWQSHSVHTLPAFSSLNPPFQIPPFAATVPVFAATQTRPVVADSFRTCTNFPFPPSNAFDCLNTNLPLFSPALSASTITPSTITNSVWSFSSATDSVAVAATPTTSIPLTPETASDCVLKFIEKKRNSNLIDLPELDDLLLHTSSDGMNPNSCKNISQTDDLLKAFDPLLEPSEPAPRPPVSPPPSSIKNPDSDQKEEDEQYALLWNWAKETTKTSSNSAFEDNFEVSEADINRKECNESPSPPPLPPRPKMNLTEDTVVVRERVKPSPPRPISHRSRQSRNYESIKVVRRKVSANSELEAFCNMVVSLRSEFLHNDFHTNIGLVISPTLESLREESTSVKLVINSVYMEKPILFTCDVTTSIEHIISHVVCTLFDDVNVNFEDFVLKVHGLAEYFSADSALVDYEYVHHCQKFDEDVRLTLISSSDLTRPLSRTAHDDANDTDIKPDQLLPAFPHPPVSQQSLSILLETFEREVEKMREQALKANADNLKSKGVLQSVKAICAILSQVETSDMTEALEGLIHVSKLFGKNKPETETNSGFTLSEEEIFNDTSSYTVVELVKQLPNTPNVRMEVLQVALERINHAIRDLIDMYCRAFRVDFDIPAGPSHVTGPPQEISCFVDALLVHIGAVHRFPPQWSTAYEQFIMVCDVYHGSRKVVGGIETKSTTPSSSLYEQIVFDEWLQFSSLMMCRLPREARIIFTLVGTKTIPTDSKLPEAGQVIQTPLVWAVLQLFQFNGVLLQGSFLCGMWPEKVDKTYGPAIHNTDPYCPVVQISLPDFGCSIVFPEELADQPSQRRDFESLDAFNQQQLLSTLELSSSASCSIEEREMFWDKRHYLYEIPQAVPRVLLAAHSWDWTCLSDIYSMLHEWTAMSPIDALELLLPTFPDIEVRKVAVSWVKNLGSDELCDYLPQLVQALKYETWDDCATAKFLLERSLSSIRVAHHLYWLLKQNVDDPRCGHRIQLVLNALLAICGRAMRSRFESQEELMQNLNEIAEKIKTTKDSLRLNTLLRELESVHYTLEKNLTSLPLSPSLEVGGMEVKSCSYFTSHTLPLKLSFKSGEEGAAPIEAIVKVGDDLRQDMLTIQMIRIMDKLCLKEGLDLHIVTFVCVATGNKKGVVEMVSGSETLRKIQTEHGLTGSFKDRPIAEWLQKHNPSELEYQQAVENFTYSCAGYSVATYVLGICDRHNDNIMLKTSGHLFHIDFGKFLGDSQMFGSIKRDRVPFVLTSDMAYVINGGDKPTSKFQHFVDLCCQAFNIIRKHGNLFLNLFALMASAGIPGVTLDAVSYIERALLLEMSDAEAAANFARMIEDSLKSWSTQLNFFIHNLAQLRFTGDQGDGTLLSFIPKTYNMETDGRILSIGVFGYQKRYDPEKFYVYVLKVAREGQPDPSFLFRSYREFWEFHQKLCMRFPLAKYHSLPRTVYLGRSNIHQVAEKRKAEIEYFLSSIWKMADEIKHCELVYTFLHPLLRDQQDGNFHLQKGKEGRECRQQFDGMIHGEVKLSIRYHSNTLFIMVMHARNLNSSKATGPDPYVKTYLVPDHNKGTKRKTKVVRRNSHPTFMEMLQYKFPLEIVQQRTLQVSVWDYDRMVENTFLGATNIVLGHLDLKKETVEWYSLGNLYR